MYFADNTRSIRVKLAGSVTTNELPIVGAWAELVASTFVAQDAQPIHTVTNGTTEVEIVGTAGSGEIRALKALTVHNADTASATVSVEAYDSSNARTIIKATLASGDNLVYESESGWKVLNSSGGESAAHALLSSTHTDTTADTVVRGDLVTGQDASPTWKRLALGSDNAVLASDGTDLAYETLTSLLDSAFGSTQGQILKRGSSAWEVLSVGADNTALTSDGTDPGYETLTSLIDAAIGSTQGSILYRNATVWTALTPGTSGQVLETQGAGANPQWANAATGGAWDLIASATASDDATVEFTGLSSTYFAYMLVFGNVIPATDGANAYLRTSTDNGSTYDSGASDYKYDYIDFGQGGGVHNHSTGASAIIIAEVVGNGTGESLSGSALLFDLSAALNAKVTYSMAHQSTNANYRGAVGGGIRDSAADVDAIQFLFSSGNVSSGTIKLYGVNAS